MNKIKDFFKNNWADIFKPIIVLLSICIIIPLALAATNMVTADKIAKLTEESNNKSMSALVDADEFKLKTLRVKEDGKVEYYSANKDGSVTAFIFITSAKGYGGDVSVMTAVDLEGNILAVDILDVSGETPGLGQNAAKESFYSQFAGKKNEITVVKNGADEDSGEINAVTGATISSKAVTSAVNKALEYYEALNITSSVSVSNGGDVG